MTSGGARSVPAAVLLVIGAALGAVPIATAVPARPSGGGPRAEFRRKMEDRLARLAAALPGASAYLIRDLSGEESFEKDADAVLAAASTIKLPIYLALLKSVEEGTIDPLRRVPIDSRARVEGGGVLEKWSEPYPALSAEQLAVLMMDFSDNYAANLLIELLGMDAVQRRFAGWGMKNTRLRRLMMDLEAARSGRENVTSPRDLVTLLEHLHRGEILGPTATRRVIEVMRRNEGTPIKRGLPAGMAAADKEGELDGLRCDAGIVFLEDPAGGGAAGGRSFAIAVMTAYLPDDRAGETLIQDVTRAACDYFAVAGRSTEHGRRIE